MKGPFSIWAFFGITIWIDAMTFVVHFFSKKKREKFDPYNPIREITVLIPAYREEKYIAQTIEGLSVEKYPIKNIIVCGDAHSEKMRKIVEGLIPTYSNLYYCQAPCTSKAKKINYTVHNLHELLGEFVYVRDARVIGEPKCIERMMSCFTDEKVAAVTSYGRISIPKSLLSRAYHYGKAWINEIGRFRKLAQELRRAVFVVCGASTVYRTKVLREIPIPSKSKTEDTHYTWILQRKGYVVKVADNATVSAPDVDGRKLTGLVSQLNQSFRWSSGTMQCLFKEFGYISKNKRLFYTTIVPGFIESVTYSTALVIAPFFLFIAPKLVLGFLIGDTVFSLVGTLIIIPKKFIKTVIHYPEIIFFKYLNALVFLYSFFKTTFEVIFGKTGEWTNEWIPPNTRLVS